MEIQEINYREADRGKYKANFADCLVLTSDNKLLVQYRPPTWDRSPDTITLFGGYVENDETIHEGLIREIHEELGADISNQEVLHVASITEEMTNHTEVVHIHFWHDKNDLIAGCYEAEPRYFKSVDEVLAQLNVMEYTRWALLKCKEADLVK